MTPNGNNVSGLGHSAAELREVLASMQPHVVDVDGAWQAHIGRMRRETGFVERLKSSRGVSGLSFARALSFAAAIIALAAIVAFGSAEIVHFSGSGPTKPASHPTPKVPTTTPRPRTTTTTPSSSVSQTSEPSSTTSSTEPVDMSIEVFGDCTGPSFEPSEIVLTCADHGVIAENLRWTTWTAVEATAVGTLSYNDCIPICAAGHRHDIAGDQITLTDPVKGAGGQTVWSMMQENPEPPGFSTGPYEGGPQPLPTRPD